MKIRKDTTIPLYSSSSSSSSTSIMRAVVVCFFVGFTALVLTITFLNISEFKEVVNSPARFSRVLQYGNNFNSSIIVKPGDNTYAAVQGTQIFINCTCPHHEVLNCTKDKEDKKEEVAPIKKSDDDRFSILIGILTRADLYERRHFLRMVYGIQSTAHAKVDVKYIFCSLYKDDQRILVPLEIMKYNDIIILDCEENMNNGKTYTYFSSLPGMGLHYDYVMKADDDVYIRIDRLAESLKPLPRNDTYYGFVIPCESMDPFNKYMSGMGFVLSWDLVEWIRESPVPKNKTEGPEDMMVGIWLDDGKKAKNRFNNKPAMYDFPKANGFCSHDLIPDTIAVHKLKDRPQWFDVLTFFNVTSAVNESKLYHL